MQVAQGGQAGRVVVTGQQNALVGVFQRGQRPDQPPGRVGEERAAHAGMRVVGDGFDVQLKVGDAAHAAVEERIAVLVHAALFPDAGVGAQQVAVRLDPRAQMRAAHFLLALGQKLDVKGQAAAMRLPYRIQSQQARDDMPFVVGHAPRKGFAVALRQLKGRAVPQVERLGRLHVVVVVEQDGGRVGVGERASPKATGGPPGTSISRASRPCARIRSATRAAHSGRYSPFADTLGMAHRRASSCKAFSCPCCNDRVLSRSHFLRSCLLLLPAVNGMNDGFRSERTSYSSRLSQKTCARMSA